MAAFYSAAISLRSRRHSHRGLLGVSAFLPGHTREFGDAPWFCAGVHAGPIIVSECGDAKRQIPYFGDSMNVAARLCGYCSNPGSEFVTDSELEGRRFELPIPRPRFTLCVLPLESLARTAKGEQGFNFIVGQSEIKDVKAVSHVSDICCTGEGQHPKLESETIDYLRN